MLRLLGFAWTVWKVAKKRFGPAYGLLIAAIAVGGYLLLQRWLDEAHREVAELFE